MASFLQEASAKKLLLHFQSFHARYGTGTSNHFDQIVSTMIANKDPYRQRHVQAEITRDVGMSGSGGQAPRKIFEDMHLLLV